jgi:hypothetical protein
MTLADQFDPNSGNKMASATEARPCFAIDWLPEIHGKVAPRVTPLVVPIVGERRCGIFPTLLPVSTTTHTSSLWRQAAPKNDAPSRRKDDAHRCLST